MTHHIPLPARRWPPVSKPTSRWLQAGCFLAVVCSGRVLAQTPAPEESPEEVAISAERQTALDNEALTISETPDAGPHLSHVTAVVGLGALFAPAYVGSNKTKTSPFPYVDIRGLFDDRMFVSVLEGVGVKILNDGPVRAGIGLNYAGGRTSSDDPRLKGLPDISGAAQVGGYIAYTVKPFVLEAKVERRLGSTSGTQVDLGASFAANPLPQLHLTVSGNVTWADASYQKTFFGITPANAAVANAQGNPLPVYTPGSGVVNAALVASGVYQLSPHWGLIARLGVEDVVGNAAKDSPLTQRTFAPSIGFGALYKF